jgi:dCMP deaminase
VDDSDKRLHDRRVKYELTCHAELNAALHAARIGTSLKGCTAYVTWPSCTRCVVAMIQAGIEEVVYPAGVEVPERWVADFERGLSTLLEAGVEVREVEFDERAD